MLRIIIPSYNEGENLENVVTRIAQNCQEYHLYIVNDGSSDNTAAVAKKLAEQYPIEVLTHAVNRGVAEAFRTGFGRVVAESAANDVLVLMEGDATSDPELLPVMESKVRHGADVVIASRYISGGGYRKFPLKRLILSWGANMLFRLLFPISGVTDYSIFYRAYRAKPVQDAWQKHGEQMITVDTFFVNCEILLKLRPFIKRVEEVPFVYDYGLKQGKSSMKIGKNLWSYLSFVARVLWQKEPRLG